MEINLLDELKIEHTVENFIKADKRYKSLLNTYILSVFKDGEELNVEECYSRLLKYMENLTIDISKEKGYFVERIEKELNKSSLYHRHDGYFKKKAVRPPLPGEDIIRSYKYGKQFYNTISTYINIDDIFNDRLIYGKEIFRMAIQYGIENSSDDLIKQGCTHYINWHFGESKGDKQWKGCWPVEVEEDVRECDLLNIKLILILIKSFKNTINSLEEKRYMDNKDDKELFICVKKMLTEGMTTRKSAKIYNKKKLYQWINEFINNKEEKFMDLMNEILTEWLNDINKNFEIYFKYEYVTFMNQIYIYEIEEIVEEIVKESNIERKKQMTGLDEVHNKLNIMDKKDIMEKEDIIEAIRKNFPLIDKSTISAKGLSYNGKEYTIQEYLYTIN